MSGVWDMLGIAPTADLMAIKRAYAARLKHTRPDDDAQAYQALREAYEAAQYQARHPELFGFGPALPAPVRATITPGAFQFTVDALPLALPTPGSAESYTPAPTQPADAPVDPPALLAAPDWTHPDALVAQAEQCLIEEGEDALAQRWPAMEASLDKLPLSLHPLAGQRFADFVVRHRNAPAALVIPLARWFGWGSDFRAERGLGSSLAIALSKRLAAYADVLEAPQPMSEPFRRRFESISAFARIPMQFPHRVRGFHLHLFALLTGSSLRRLWFEATARERRALGVPIGQWHASLGSVLTVTSILRTTLVILACHLLLFRGRADAFGEAVLASLFVGYVGLILVEWAEQANQAIWSRRQERRDKKSAGRLQGHPASRPSWPALIFMALAACAGLVADIATRSPLFDATGSAFYASLALLLAALALWRLNLPRSPASGALLPILGLCGAIVYVLPPFSRHPGFALGLAGCWVMGSAVAYAWHRDAIAAAWSKAHDRLFLDGVDRTRWLLLMASSWLFRLTVGWPYLLMQSAATHSTRWVAALACLTLVATPFDLHAAWLVFGWLALLLLDRLSWFYRRSVIDVIWASGHERLRAWVLLLGPSAWIVWTCVYVARHARSASAYGTLEDWPAFASGLFVTTALPLAAWIMALGVCRILRWSPD